MFTFRFLILVSIVFIFTDLTGQTETVTDEFLINAAQEIIQGTETCALITLDSTGYPQVRTMEVLPVEENFTVWFGTNKNSRKVQQIKHDTRVTIYYADPSGSGYVVLNGNAEIVNDETEKEKHWQEDWDQFYPDREEIFILIKVKPTRLEVVSYKHNITGDPVTWRAQFVEFDEE